MSKKKLFVLIISLLLIGCSNNDIVAGTNEPTNETDSVAEESNIVKDHQYILKGKLLSNEPPHGTSIELDDPLKLKVNGKQEEYSFSFISLNNDEVYNYVERDQFTYEEPFILLKQDANISVQVKVDLTNFFESNNINAIDESQPLFIENFEILEVDGEKQLLDKSDQPYPFEVSDSDDDTNKNVINNVIIDLICSNYNVENLREILNESLEIVNVDFTGDGIQDVICYVNDVTLGFYDMVFIVKEDSELKILDFEGKDYQKYAHSAYFDGTFIHYITESSGQGISGKSQSLFVYDAGKIKDTGAGVYLEGNEAQPPTPSFPEGYETETVSRVDFDNAENDYKAFKVTSVTKGSKNYTVTSHFKYNEESKNFDVETTIVDSDNNESILSPKDIHENQSIGGLNVSDVVWKENDSFELTLDGEVQLNGVIRGSFSEMYMENEFFFISNDKFEKPISYNYLDWEKQIDCFSGLITKVDLLDTTVQNYLLEGNELNVVATVTSYSYGDKFESEGYESIEIQTIELLDEQMSNETSDSKANKSFVDPKIILVGQTFEGLKVSSIYYEEGRSINLKLTGSLSSNGILTGVLDNGYGETEFYYTSNENFDKPIQYTFDSSYSKSFKSFSGSISDTNLILDADVKQYILDGNSLAVAGDITYFSHAMLDQSDAGGNWLNYSIIEITDEEWLLLQEESSPSLEDEIFTTTNQGDFYVDYSRYSSVIIPMLESKNSNQLNHMKVDFNGETELKFTVIGSFEDVQINYVPYAGEEGEWNNLGTISDTVVELNANLPNDTSTIFVTGKVLTSNGTYENIKFTLDDMRDLSDYDLYLIEN